MSDKGQCRHCGKPYTLCGCFIARLAEEANAANVATAAQRTLFAVAAKELRSALDALAAMTASRDRLATECRAWRAAWDGRDACDYGYADPDHDHTECGVWDGGQRCESCSRFELILSARAAVDAAGDLEEPNAKG